MEMNNNHHQICFVNPPPPWLPSTSLPVSESLLRRRTNGSPAGRGLQRTHAPVVFFARTKNIYTATSVGSLNRSHLSYHHNSESNFANGNTSFNMYPAFTLWKPASVILIKSVPKCAQYGDVESLFRSTERGIEGSSSSTPRHTLPVEMRSLEKIAGSVWRAGFNSPSGAAEVLATLSNTEIHGTPVQATTEVITATADRNPLADTDLLCRLLEDRMARKHAQEIQCSSTQSLQPLWYPDRGYCAPVFPMQRTPSYRPNGSPHHTPTTRTFTPVAVVPMPPPDAHLYSHPIFAPLMQSEEGPPIRSTADGEMGSSGVMISPGDGGVKRPVFSAIPKFVDPFQSRFDSSAPPISESCESAWMRFSNCSVEKSESGDDSASSQCRSISPPSRDTPSEGDSRILADQTSEKFSMKILS